jgi:hypothetical protein
MPREQGHILHFEPGFSRKRGQRATISGCTVSKVVWRASVGLEVHMAVGPNR